MITREALRVLENNLTFTRQLNRTYRGSLSSVDEDELYTEWQQSGSPLTWPKYRERRSWEVWQQAQRKAHEMLVARIARYAEEVMAANRTALPLNRWPSYHDVKLAQDATYRRNLEEQLRRQAKAEAAAKAKAEAAAKAAEERRKLAAQKEQRRQFEEKSAADIQRRYFSALERQYELALSRAEREAEQALQRGSPYVIERDEPRNPYHPADCASLNIVGLHIARHGPEPNADDDDPVWDAARHMDGWLPRELDVEMIPRMMHKFTGYRPYGPRYEHWLGQE